METAPSAAAQRVVVVGQGYVGLPLAVRAVEVGYAVVGFDVDPERVKRLQSGESYVEDITSDRLAAVLAPGGGPGRDHPEDEQGRELGR